MGADSLGAKSRVLPLVSLGKPCVCLSRDLENQVKTGEDENRERKKEKRTFLQQPELIKGSLLHPTFSSEVGQIRKGTQAAYS